MLRIALFDAHKFERAPFNDANKEYGFTIEMIEARLSLKTVALANGYDVVCSFVNDKLDAEVITQLKEYGVKLIALRSAGFNHVDLNAAGAAGIKVVRVPAYSPYAVAEHAVCLILALNRKIHRSFARVRELNFSLDGLVGFDLHGKTVGVIGTGKIGEVFCKIMLGFGCKVIAFDPQINESLVGQVNFQYVSFDELLLGSDIISLHAPLVPQTLHMLDFDQFAKMKSGVVVINTSRGKLINTEALIDALKKHKVGAAGLDVYEEEENVFFQDLSETGIEDDILARLLTFPNVLITSHQAFLTNEALGNIATTTLSNILAFSKGHHLDNEVRK
ncbi:MAG: hydroxyacid dehydrogenase [Bdellovibrionales bacterium CG10_big_fil_rev_8_21_14_0_10_45_34]|nr:MAG: hydroxyacid dehydrogenase [Bdellovibrionales bacterium CG10_big_fil_rev_8_21_14_0_10_45_34]